MSMAEQKRRPQITITLGPSGQVVKRSGALFDTQPVQPVGTKRSIRDRLGATLDADHYNNKRLRGDNGRWSLNASKSMDDLHLSKSDLRFKIMKKAQSNSQHNTVDLRDMLSRRARPSTTNPDTPNSLDESRQGRQRVPKIIPEIRDDRRRILELRDSPRHMPELRNERQGMPDPRDERQHIPERREERLHIPELREERQHIPEQRDERQHIPERRDVRQHIPERRDERSHLSQPRDDRRRMPESRDERQRMDEPRDGRQNMPDQLEVRQRIPKLDDSRHSIPEPTNDSMSRQFTSMRTSEVPSQMDYLRNPYSSWTIDHIRRRSPDRVVNNSRGLSPPMRTEELQTRPMIREYENPRPVSFTSRDVGQISRPVANTSFLTKPSLPVVPTKSAGPLIAPPLPPVSTMQRSQYPVEHLTVEGFLRSLGLEKYLISFKVEEVDMAALSQMGDHDLKDMGIPMGPRKKILLALVARTRRLAR